MNIDIGLERSVSGLAVVGQQGRFRVRLGADPVADVLRAVPLIAEAGPDVIGWAAERAELVRVRAGEWLFRAGDAADALYVVASGRVEVLLDDERSTRLASLGRGDVVGELGLLTGDARAASVRAERDTELVRLAGEDFSGLLREHPEAAVALMRALSLQLKASRAREIPTPTLPLTIALVPVSPDAPLRELRETLAPHLARYERVVELAGHEADTDDDRARLLDRIEREHDQVLLVAENARPDDPWTAFCLRQADRVVAVAAGRAPDPGALEHLRGCDLAFCAGPGGTAAAITWTGALAPERRYMIGHGERFGAGAARMARRLAGRSLGVVLSGGGARGFAHLGVLDVLRESGLEIDRIGGTSMGAIVSALIAMGLSVDEVYARLDEEFVRRNPMNDFTLPLVALTRGKKGEALMRRQFGELYIEELEADFFCVSCDLRSSEVVVHRTGWLAEAVGASSSIPAYVPPVTVGERLLVDGGVLNNLPVDRMPRQEGPVIAVNVSSSAAPPPAPTRWRRPRTRAIARAVRFAVTGVEEKQLGFTESLIRTVVLGSADTDAAAERHADFAIVPNVHGIDLLDWKALPQMRREGAAAAREALERAPTGLLL